MTNTAQSEVRTFLIADVRGYTRFTLEHGDEAAAKLARRFAEIASEVVASREGEVIELRGDEALAVFTSARQALRASIELQDRFLSESQISSLPFKVGVGLDSGEAIAVGDGYRGAALNLAARLCALAGPGEVLASDTVSNLARKIEGVEYSQRGSVLPKGFADEVRVVGVRPSPLQIDGAQPFEATDTHEQPLPIGGFLGALPAGMLVAREEELRKVLSTVDVVTGGTGRLVLLAGEPGAGKTRLAQEVSLAVRNRGFVLATGTCYEPRQSVPYYPFLDVLAKLYEVAPGSVRDSIARHWPYLGRLLPETGISVPGSPGEGQEEQERLFRAVAGFIQAIARTVPVALFLDDLHWADASSLDLLQHLARHTRAYPVLLLGTYRDVEVGRQHPLERALRDLNRESLVERVAVRRLEPEGTRELMAATFGQEQMSVEFSELVHSHTEGNPFFTQEVLRALVERGDIYRENGHWQRKEVTEIEVPESVRSTIGERLSRLSEEAQEILTEASVLGLTFAFVDLQTIEGRREPDVEAALDEAMEAGLIRETRRNHYGFNHALTQQSLYGELSGRKKRRLHLAAGEAIERLPDQAREKRTVELAWHFAESDDAERALRYAMLAGDKAHAVFAHTEAEQQYRTALDLAETIGDTKREAEALDKLGQILVYTGRTDQALQALERAAGIYQREGDLQAEGLATAWIGFAHRRMSNPAKGIERIQGLLPSLESQGPSGALARLYVGLEGLYFSQGRYQEAMPMAERAAEIAREIGDTQLVIGTEVSLGTELLATGHLEQAREVLERAVAAGEGFGHHLIFLGRAQNNLASACEFQGHLVQALHHYKRSRERQEEKGDYGAAAFATAASGHILELMGEWETARAYLQEAIQMMPEEFDWHAAYPPLHLGRLDLHEGKWREASVHLERSIAVASSGNDLQALRGAHGLLAERDICQGNPAAAIARLSFCRDHDASDAMHTLVTLGWAYLEKGEETQAEEVLEEVLITARNSGYRLVLADALRIKAMLLGRRGQWSDSASAFDESVALARTVACPYAEASGLYQFGVSLLRMPEPEQARERLKEALTIFQRLGAKKDIERAEQALSRTGEVQD